MVQHWNLTQQVSIRGYTIGREIIAALCDTGLKYVCHLCDYFGKSVVKFRVCIYYLYSANRHTNMSPELR